MAHLKNHTGYKLYSFIKGSASTTKCECDDSDYKLALYTMARHRKVFWKEDREEDGFSY